ncbi:2,3-diaminopropionate biosynthesis protein SbnA [Nitrospina sp. 32_T5]|uniref:2,3-diaminopropionate biosynthesis protein SbnA n=1 Tax=unclassified Nitrospina TaxID=2638683 RepID=UPI003F9E709D
MVHESVVSCVGNTPLVRLSRLFSHPGLDVIAKLELLNPGGSVKDRPARFIVEQGLRDGSIRPGTHLIESTSGNLGIALAMNAKIHGLAFTCVVDPKISETNLRIIKLLGARIDMVEEKDDQGGYLKSRIKRVKALLQEIPNSIWVNQYANENNLQSHYQGEGEEIIRQLDGPIDCLVVGVSTSGTILGLARRLRDRFPNLRVVAVDAFGSVIFGTEPRPRQLPGIGASRIPELLKPEEIDEVIHVSDWESVQGCHALLAKEGIFAGGSSGSVVAAIQKLLPTFPRPYRVLTLFPDRGDRYLDMVYDESWVSGLGREVADLAYSLPARDVVGLNQSLKVNVP